jgi:tetratricopeptide (TPR) repeat protein
LNQKFTLAYCKLSAVYHKIGKEDLSKEMLEKAREAGPHAADLMMVDVWDKFGEPDLAVASCLKCIARDSADAAVYSKLGWLNIKSKEWEKAIAAYRKLVKLDPSDALAYINLSNLFYETGQLQAAKEAYLKAVEIDPDKVRSVINRQPTNE